MKTGQKRYTSVCLLVLTAILFLQDHTVQAIRVTGAKGHKKSTEQTNAKSIETATIESITNSITADAVASAHKQQY